jgi:hypothetical protein
MGEGVCSIAAIVAGGHGLGIIDNDASIGRQAPNRNGATEGVNEGSMQR